MHSRQGSREEITAYHHIDRNVPLDRQETVASSLGERTVLVHVGGWGPALGGSPHAPNKKQAENRVCVCVCFQQ